MDVFHPSEVAARGRYIGSGFFIDSNGHILTCHHVISDAVKPFINVLDEGKKSYPADVISVYPEIDMAVIKVRKYSNKVYMKIGDSSTCNAETDVIALGYSHRDDTVKTTKGIISGSQEHLLQTDTAINNGNSDGPLLNNVYEVIGINSSKRTGDYVEGTGYSIPINIFKTVRHLMLTKNIPETRSDIFMVHKPNLYCRFQNLEHSTAELLCYDYCNKIKSDKVVEGYMITSIHNSSPLKKCKSPLNPYDILIEFDRKHVDSYSHIEKTNGSEKIDIDSYVIMCKHNEDIPIKYFSVRNQQMVETNIKFENNYLYGIPEDHYPRQIDFIDICGVIICELTLDHVSGVINGECMSTLKNVAQIYNYTIDANREEPRIFIAKVLPHSDNIDNKNLEDNIGGTIHKTNGRVVSTIQENQKSIL
jgi:S1-C subfamily serine protease